MRSRWPYLAAGCGGFLAGIIFTVLALILGGLALGGMAARGQDVWGKIVAGLATPTPAPAIPPALLPPSSGAVGWVGEWDFAVGRLEERERLGQGILERRAQGIFLLLPVTLENKGKTTAVTFRLNFFLVDREGNEYASSPEGQGALAMSEGATLPGFQQVQPGERLTVKIVFDVPKGKAKGPWKLRVKDVSERVLGELPVPQ